MRLLTRAVLALGAVAAVSATVTPAVATGAPTAPTLTSVTAGNQSIAVAWSPADGNGLPIDSYTVSWQSDQPGSYNETTLAGDATSYTITGLHNNDTYTVSVAADNSSGRGPAATSDPVTPSPGQVTSLTVTPYVSWPGGYLTTGVNVSWQAPDSRVGVRVCLDPPGQAPCSGGGGIDVPAPATSADIGMQPGFSEVVSAAVYDSEKRTGPSSTQTFTGTQMTGNYVNTLVLYGSAPVLATTVTEVGSGAPVAGAAVQLYSRLVGASTWALTATPTSDSAGHVAVTVKPQHSTDYRFVFAGDASRLAVANYTTLWVRYAVKAKLTRLKLAHGVREVLYGTVAPATRGERIDVKVGNNSGWGWSTVKKQRLPDGRYTWGFVIPFTFHKAGTTRVWAAASGNIRNSGNNSAKIKVLVT